MENEDKTKCKAETLRELHAPICPAEVKAAALRELQAFADSLKALAP